MQAGKDCLVAMMDLLYNQARCAAACHACAVLRCHALPSSAQPPPPQPASPRPLPFSSRGTDDATRAQVEGDEENSLEGLKQTIYKC